VQPREPGKDGSHLSAPNSCRRNRPAARHAQPIDSGMSHVGFTSRTTSRCAADATNGTLLWQGVDKRGGTTSAVGNSLNPWLDVRHAFQAWSSLLVSRLVSVVVCSSGQFSP
jgi:hypothetical protein